MNYYLKKRLNSDIKRSDMANMLGLDYNFYHAIEKGSVKMPINLINKFNEIINKGKENEILGVENTIRANEFWEQMHKKDSTGRWELVNKMHEFNIKNYEELVALLGYKSVGTIYNYLEDRNPVGNEFKKRLYNFFNDETNIQIPKSESKPKATYKINNESRKANPKLDKYYERTNFKKIMKENNITNVQIADAIGVHNSTVSTLTCKKYKPSYRIIQLVKDYLENNIPKEEKPTQEDYISKSKVLETCEQEIASNFKRIEALRNEIADIESKIETLNRVMSVIKNM